MYCPHCGQVSSENRKFCTYCGTNLSMISQALSKGSPPSKSLSETTAKILEDWFGTPPEPPPEKKQLNDIRNGVITMCAGLGVSLFLYFLMRAIASSPAVDPEAVPILRSVWAAGLIPFFVGMGLMINGIFFAKPLQHPTPRVPTRQGQMSSPDTQRVLSEPGSRIPSSVTEQTTYRLETPSPLRPEPERDR